MASTNRTQLVALARDANKNRPSGKKIAVVGRTNEAIAKAASEAWEGEILEVSELGELDDDAIY